MPWTCLPSYGEQLKVICTAIKLLFNKKNSSSFLLYFTQLKSP